jgi:hypothetical protein
MLSWARIKPSRALWPQLDIEPVRVNKTPILTGVGSAYMQLGNKRRMAATKHRVRRFMIQIPLKP